MKTIYNKTWLIAIIFITISNLGYSTNLIFEYKGFSTPSCNPYVNQFDFYDAWKPTHGSPSCASKMYNDGFYTEAKLVSSYKQDQNYQFVKLSEGLYISYNFNSSHSYSITVNAKSAENNIKCHLYAANGITTNSNSNCSQGSLPNVSDKQIILAEYIDDFSYNDYENSSFTPQHNFSQIWIYSEVQFLDKSSSIYVHSVDIIDNGIFDNQSPTPPTNLTVSNKTSSSCIISWTASTDNIGVTAYYIYNNNSQVGTVNSSTTSYTLTNLASCSSNNITVKAKDAAKNYSSAASITVNTLSDIQSTLELGSNYTSYVTYDAQATNYVLLKDGFSFIPSNSSYEFTAQIVSGECSTLRSLSMDQSLVEESFEVYNKEITSTNSLVAEKNQVSVFPNPANTTITISAPFENEKIYNIAIFDMIGKQVLRQAITIDNNVVGVSTIPEGIYIINISNGVNTYKQKVNIKH